MGRLVLICVILCFYLNLFTKQLHVGAAKKSKWGPVHGRKLKLMMNSVRGFGPVHLNRKLEKVNGDGGFKEDRSSDNDGSSSDDGIKVKEVNGDGGWKNRGSDDDGSSSDDGKTVKEVNGDGGWKDYGSHDDGSSSDDGKQVKKVNGDGGWKDRGSDDDGSSSDDGKQVKKVNGDGGWKDRGSDDDGSSSDDGKQVKKVNGDGGWRDTHDVKKLKKVNGDGGWKNFKKNKSSYEGKKYNQEKLEKEAGKVSNIFPSNKEHYVPYLYKDFGRRFIPQYPYDDGQGEELEETLEKAVKKFQLKNDRIKMNMTPVKASPELVIAVVKQSQLLQTDQTEEEVDKESLRNGGYWNALWKEDVNPDVLRSPRDSEPILSEEKIVDSSRNLKSLKVRLNPKSTLFDLVSILQDHSPRLLYVINTDRKNS